MGQRELLLVLGALTIFGTTILTANRFIVSQNNEMLEHEFEYFAASQAQTYIEEAKNMAYDENVINNTPLSLPTGFTSAGSLGPNGGETYADYDDVDDFDGFSETINSGRGDFVVEIVVAYVDPVDPDNTTTTKKYCKKMTVTVTNDMLDHPVILSQVFGYIKN